jgi:uncharacterized membrane protein
MLPPAPRKRESWLKPRKGGKAGAKVRAMTARELAEKFAQAQNKKLRKQLRNAQQANKNVSDGASTSKKRRREVDEPEAEEEAGHGRRSGRSYNQAARWIL